MSSKKAVKKRPPKNSCSEYWTGAVVMGVLIIIGIFATNARIDSANESVKTNTHLLGVTRMELVNLLNSMNDLNVCPSQANVRFRRLEAIARQSNSGLLDEMNNFNVCPRQVNSRLRRLERNAEKY